MKPIDTIQAKIATGTKKTGQIAFTRDSQRLFWDYDDSTRVEITDIVELDSDTTRLGLGSPADKFYYVLNTNTLWRYQDGSWKQVGSNTVISATKPSGQSVGDTWLKLL